MLLFAHGPKVHQVLPRDVFVLVSQRPEFCSPHEEYDCPRQASEAEPAAP